MSGIELLGLIASIWTLCYPTIVLVRVSIAQLMTNWKIVRAEDYDGLVAAKEVLEALQLSHEEAAKALSTSRKSG